MLMADILHSCKNPDIADAAVASIGGSFAMRMQAEASRSGLSVGVLTVSLVSRFAVDASERDWRDLAVTMVGADQPVLSGLEAMADRMLVTRERQSRRLFQREAMPAALRPAAVPVCCVL